MTRILALDPGLEIGYSVLEASEDSVQILEAGTVPCTKAKKPDLVLFWEWLIQKASEPFDVLVADQLLENKGAKPTWCPKAAYHVEGVVALIAQMLEEEKGVKVRTYPGATIKSIIGRGRKIDKDGIRARMETWFGMNFGDQPDHVSDAVGHGVAFAIRELNWSPPTVELPTAQPKKPRRQSRRKP